MEQLKPINVFWLDDKFDSMQNFRIDAEQHGIVLHGFTSAEEGLPVLEARLDFYDAVLLDALFFKNKDQVAGTEKLNGLKDAIDRLNQLSNRKAFTPFILTGQERIEKNEEFKDVFGAFYRKGDPKNVQQLFKDIRAAAEAMADTQIRHRYQRVFDVCTEKYIGDAAAENLLAILRHLHGDQSQLSDELYFNHLRKTIEWTFRAANRTGLLHDKCIDEKGRVNLWASSLFLCGKEVGLLGVHCSKAHFPKQIAEQVRYILDVTNAHSHTESWENEQSRSQLESYRQAVDSPYLLFSLTFMLMDVLLWFKAYADANRDVTHNRSFWSNIEIADVDQEQIGQVINLNPKGFAFFRPDADNGNVFITQRFVTEHALENGIRVAVRSEPKEKGPTAVSLRVLAPESKA